MNKSALLRVGAQKKFFFLLLFKEIETTELEPGRRRKRTEKSASRGPKSVAGKTKQSRFAFVLVSTRFNEPETLQHKNNVLFFPFYNINGNRNEHQTPFSQLGFCRRNKIEQAGNLCSLHAHRIPALPASYNRIKVEIKVQHMLPGLQAFDECKTANFHKLNGEAGNFWLQFLLSFRCVAWGLEADGACWSLIRLFDVVVIDESLAPFWMVLNWWSNRIPSWVAENGDGPKSKNRTETVVILFSHRSVGNK